MTSPSAATIVLLGATGMLGRAMVSELERRGAPVVAPSRSRLDLAVPGSIRAFDWPRGVWHIVNCAAWTDVDGAEAHDGAATTLNATALDVLAGVRGPSTVLLNFSTDYVFDGGGSTPWLPDDPRSPINAYGRSKAAGEAVLEALPDGRWLNVRTSWLYAPWGRNFVVTMSRLLRQEPEVRVVSDQRGRPTSAVHLARCSVDLLESGVGGHWHVTDGGECSWYEFAVEIGAQVGGPARVTPCTTADLARPAARPAYSVLDLARTEALLGPMPDWRLNLRAALAQASGAGLDA